MALLGSLPQQQTAVVARGSGQLSIEHNTPLPSMLPDMAIVKTVAVAINPVDAKMLDYSPAPGAIHGYDFAGIIVALGSEVSAQGRLAVGDRVAGLVHGMNKLQPNNGAFAQYVGAPVDLLLKVPDDMSLEKAASFGTGVATACLGLFSELQIPESFDRLVECRSLPSKQSQIGSEAQDFVLVAGGSTATGTRAIQLAKLAGLRPIATCSPSSFDLVLRFGAEKAFDYRSSTAAADIRAYTRNELAYALDCVSVADTTKLCYASIGRAGGRYVSLEPFRETVAQIRSLTIEPSWIMALTIFGREVALDGEYRRDARPQDRHFGAKATAAVQALLDRGLIETHPVKVMSGGWEGVMQGVDTIRRETLSGHKLVYPV